MDRDEGLGQEGQERMEGVTARGTAGDAVPDSAAPGGEAIDALRGRVAPDPARIAGGWTPRFVVGPDRLEEVVWLYRELGFDVVADPVRPVDMENDCRDCRLLVQLQFRYVYTKGGAGAG